MQSNLIQTSEEHKNIYDPVAIQEYQMLMGNELKQLKEMLMERDRERLQPNNQIELLNEIDTYKNMINSLRDQIEELKKSSNSDVSDKDTDGKIKLLESKKKEILNELSRVKSEHEKLENIMEQHNRSESSLENKKKELLKIIEQYDYKIFNEEHTMVIDNSNLQKINNRVYRYKLPFGLENVMQITLLDHNINNNMYNITPYNNILKIDGIEMEDNSNIKNDDIMVYKIENRMLEIRMEYGRYELDEIVVELNKILNKCKIEIGYDKKYIMYIRSLEDKEFRLMTDENTINKILGLEEEEGKSKYIGKRAIDLRVCKQINMNIVNINGSLLGRININQNKIISGIMITKPSIKRLDYLDLLITGDNSQPYWLRDNYSFTISIKGKIIEDDMGKYMNGIIVNSVLN